jgi:UDP-N-acetylmuramyl pentapeptide phosphotransferase/UDP-N-acetylglucosamine-1-phosphate transferase
MIPAAIGAAFLALIVLSFIDDLRSLPVWVRLGAHLLAAAAAASLVWRGEGVAIAVIAALACAWTINAFNFMDGSDGMAGGMALAGFAAYGILALGSGDEGLAAVCFSLAAASAAFLVFNVHPARIFLGDAGSVPLGYLAGALGILGWARGLWSPFVPLVVFSPFLADATITLGRRCLARERIWRAHHDHYYQRLVRSGWGHRKTAFAAWATMLAAAGVAIAISDAEPGVQLQWTSAWGALLCALALAIEVRWRKRPAAA